VVKRVERRLTDNTEAAGPPLNAVIMSGLLLFMVGVLIPLAAGSSIAIAASLGGEKANITVPDDANGVGWAYYMGADGCSVGNTLGSIVTEVDGRNWTTLSNPYEQNCGATAPEYTLSLPSNVFAANASHSGFLFEWLASSGCSTSSCNQDAYGKTYTFDVQVIVGGQVVADIVDLESSTSNMIVGTTRYSHITLEHRFSLVEFNDLVDAVDACDPACSTSLRFTNMSSEDPSSVATYNGWFATSAGKVHFEALATDNIASGLVMAVVPPAIGAAGALIALASTPMWNPVASTVMKGGRK